MRLSDQKRQQIIDLHKQGKGTVEIASLTEVHRSTVSRLLVREGLVQVGEHGGPVRKPLCAKGHSMEDAYEVKGGGRECKTCKKVRGARNYRDQMLMKAILEVQGPL